MLPENSGSNPRDNDSIILKRRRFIRTTLHAYGKITEGEIRTWLRQADEEFSLKAIRNDLEVIASYDLRRIFEQRDPESEANEKLWVDDSRKIGTTKGQRLGHNSIAKQRIGELLTSLVLGFKNVQLNSGLHGEVNGEEFTITNLEGIMESLKSFNDTDLSQKLEAFWRVGQRSLFLDAGTTTQTFARDFLQYFQLPMDGMGISAGNATERSVNKIEVVTNDRHIFFSLGEPFVNVKTIVVGGRQQSKSSAISGLMAEKFLDANNLTAAMAIIGTTMVCLSNSRGDSPYICAENEHTASIKNHFLDRAQIKIIIADSSKFDSLGMHSDTRIRSIKRNQIDLVVTDYADEDVITQFKQYGVPLISHNRVMEMQG